MMRVYQLNKTWVKISYLEISFLNYFLQDRFYPDVEFYGGKKWRKNLSNR